MQLNRSMYMSRVSQSGPTLNCITKLLENEDKGVTIVDLGCGMGLYGFLLRSLYGNKINLIGVDIKFQKHSLPILEKIYNTLVEEDIRTYEIPKDSIVLAFHIIEHLPWGQVSLMLDKIKQTAKSSLIALPRPKEGFEYKDQISPDTHKWGFSLELFSNTDFKLVNDKNPILLEWLKI